MDEPSSVIIPVLIRIVRNGATKATPKVISIISQMTSIPLVETKTVKYIDSLTALEKEFK